jgi:hypothetical protein
VVHGAAAAGDVLRHRRQTGYVLEEHAQRHVGRGQVPAHFWVDRQGCRTQAQVDRCIYGGCRDQGLGWGTSLGRWERV